MPGGGADEDDDGEWLQATGGEKQLRSAWRGLAVATASSLLVLYGRNRSDRSAFAAAGAAALAVSNQRAASLADVYLARLLRTEPLGVVARDADAGRLEQALLTASDPDVGATPEAAVERLGQAEPLRSGQLGLTDGMVQHGLEGWTRVASGSPCVICANLSDGSILPADVEMYSHVGCSCVARPVTH